MTEGTADAAVRKALETCTAQTGVTVDRQPVPYPELVQKVLLAASSNSLPDIIYIDNSDVAQLADGGYIAPLSDVGIKTEGFVPALAALGNYKGTDYAVPSANNTIALYYNTDMLKAAGRGAAEDLGRAARDGEEADQGPDLWPRLPRHQQRAGRVPYLDLRLVERRHVRKAQLAGGRRRAHLPEEPDRRRLGLEIGRDMGDRRRPRPVRLRPRRDDDRRLLAPAAARRASGPEIRRRAGSDSEGRRAGQGAGRRRALGGFGHRQQGSGEEGARMPFEPRRPARIRQGPQQHPGASRR